MFRQGWFFAQLLFVVCSSPVWGVDYLIARESVKLRAGPDGVAPVVASLDRGTRMEALDTRGNWLNARLEDGREGWVFRGVLQDAATELVRRPDVQQHLGRYWLLAIAVNEYQFWPKLRTAVNDAQEVVKVLTDEYSFEPDHVITLFDAEATIDNVMSTFQKLKTLVQPEDSVLIYYAGHGILDDFNSGSWIPVNAREERLADYITTDRVNRVIAALTAKHVFLVADACYSGALFTARGREMPEDITERYFLERVQRASRQALTSGGIEEVLDDGREGHSVFAYHFLRELRLNTAMYFAASSLSSQVEELVLRNADQRPRWDRLRNTGDENGDFFFVRRETPVSNTAALTVRTEPADAVIFVEGERMGQGKVTLPAGLTDSVVVTAEKAGYQRLDRSLSVSVESPRSEVVLTLAPNAPSVQDTRTVTDRFNSLLIALQKKNEAALAEVATLSVTAAPVWSKLQQFDRIDAQIRDVKVLPDRATATLHFVELHEAAGDIVIPGSHWQTETLTVNKTNEQWGKVQW